MQLFPQLQNLYHKKPAFKKMKPKSNIIVAGCNSRRGIAINEPTRCYIQLTEFSKYELSTLVGLSKFSIGRCSHIRAIDAGVDFLSCHAVPIKYLTPLELENNENEHWNFAEKLPEIVMEKIQENELLLRKYSEGLPLKTVIADKHKGPLLIQSVVIDITNEYYIRLRACGSRCDEDIWVDTAYFPLKMLEDAMDCV